MIKHLWLASFDGNGISSCFDVLEPCILTTLNGKMPSPPRRNSSGLAAKRGFVGSVARFWQKTYAPDYVGLTILVVAYILVLIAFSIIVQSWLTSSSQLENFAVPFHRMFRLDDPNLQYPHAEVERVPLRECC